MLCSLIIFLFYIKEIINKYQGGFPNKNNKNTFNADIKEIGKLAEINSDVVITKKKGTEKIDKFYKSDWDFINKPTSIKFRKFENVFTQYIGKHMSAKIHLEELKARTNIN